MHYHALLFAAMLVIGQLAAAQELESPPTAAVVPNCVVAAAEQADLPPYEPGVLMLIKAHEGQQVDAKELLVQLDDRKAQRELEVAQAKFSAAQFKANDDINVRYASSAAEAAKAEYDVSVKANHDVPGTIPAVKMNELYLKVTETKLSIEKARLDKHVAAEEAKVAAAETRAAEVLIERHQIHSPIDGVVQELRVHLGEYVQPTQAIMRVVRLDRLWVEGSASAAKYARNELEGRTAKIEVVLARDQKMAFAGRIIFVKAEIEAGNKFMVRAEVDNRKVNGSWLLTPGMRATMTIELN